LFCPIFAIFRGILDDFLDFLIFWHLVVREAGQ
jgi:hypothetical protein